MKSNLIKILVLMTVNIFNLKLKFYVLMTVNIFNLHLELECYQS